MSVNGLPFDATVHESTPPLVVFTAVEELARTVREQYYGPEADQILSQAERFIQAGLQQQKQTLAWLNEQKLYDVAYHTFPRRKEGEDPMHASSPYRTGASWAQTSPIPFKTLTEIFVQAGLRSHMPVEIDPETGIARQTLSRTGVNGPGPFGLMNAPNFSCEFMLLRITRDKDGAPLLSCQLIVPFSKGYPPTVVRPQMPGGMEQYTVTEDHNVIFDPNGRAKEFFEEMLSGSVVLDDDTNEQIQKELQERLVSDPEGNNPEKLERRIRAEFAVRFVQDKHPTFFDRLQAIIHSAPVVSEGVYIHPKMTDEAWGESSILSVDYAAVEALMTDVRREGLSLEWAAGDDAGHIIETPLHPGLMEGWQAATFAWGMAYACLKTFIDYDGAMPPSICRQIAELDSALVARGLLPARLPLTQALTATQ